MLFMHVRKTGGTSLSRAVANRFAARDCLSLYEGPPPQGRKPSHYPYVSGHVNVAFIDGFPATPFLITVLRDPVERALSAYSYYRWFPPEEYERLLPELGPEAYERRVEAMRIARESSLGDFIGRAPALAVEALGNVQTRVLCGSRPEGGEERLPEAIAALERFDFIGLTEELEESAVWLARRLGWAPLGPLPRSNVTENRLRSEDLTPAEREALAGLTALDAELYRHGRGLYEDQIAAWKRLDDPHDGSADFPDAPPVSDLSFAEPIQGSAWSGRERSGGDGEPWFCWIGHCLQASVELRVGPEAAELLVEVPHVLEQSMLETLSLSVNGTRVAHGFAERDGMLTASAPLSPQLLGPGAGGTLRVEVEVDHVARPVDVNPASTDGRRLAIAVSRIALT